MHHANLATIEIFDLSLFSRLTILTPNSAKRKIKLNVSPYTGVCDGSYNHPGQET